MAGEPQKGRQPRGKPGSLWIETLKPYSAHRNISALEKWQERRTPEAVFVAERGKTLEGSKAQEGNGLVRRVTLKIEERLLAGSKTLKPRNQAGDQARRTLAEAYAGVIC